MNRKNKHEFLSSEYIWFWAALAFQAGFANAGGFLACSRYVSHMTGFGTQVGISLSQLDYAVALEMFTAPLSFLLGAMVSAFAVDRRIIHKRNPRYLEVMLGIAIVFVLVAIGGVLGVFGDFGEPLRLQRDFALMSLLCFACGMQNACFSSLTGGQIRTTHLTGILTDIGVTFIKLFYVDKGHRYTKRLKRVNFIRSITVISFSSGSAMSAILFTKVGYFGFGILACASLLLFSITVYKQRSIQQFTARKNQWRLLPKHNVSTLVP